MTVMITGGTGLVGLNLAEALLARGEHVVVVALDDPPPSARRVFARLPGRLTATRADVTDTDAITAVMREHRVDRLFPFAAITAAAAREAAMPERIIEVNLLAFIGQLRAARAVGVRRIVAPASASVYGESFYTHALLDEVTTPCIPTGVYGMTKYAVERTGLRLGALWGLDVVVARIGSVFGPWERETGLRDLIGPHWHLARQALAGREAVLPAAIPAYTWTYARDIAAGLVHLLDLESPPERVFNICSSQPWGAAITGFADRLATRFPGFRWRQGEAPGVPFTDDRPRGMMANARLRATGWQPRFPPAEAYADYTEWLAANPDALEN